MKLLNWPKGVDFIPHGMDIEDKLRRLYVINHAKNNERIEVFQVNKDGRDVPQSLKYLYSIMSDELNVKAYGSLNGLTVVAPN